MFYSTVLNMMSAPTCLKKFLEDAQLLWIYTVFKYAFSTFFTLFRDIMFYSTVLNMMSVPTCLKKFLEDAQLMFSLIKYRLDLSRRTP